MSDYPSMSMAVDKDHLILLHRKEIDRLKAQLAEAVSKADVARAVHRNTFVTEIGGNHYINGKALWEDLADLGITPDLLEGGQNDE